MCVLHVLLLSSTFNLVDLCSEHVVDRRLNECTIIKYYKYKSQSQFLPIQEFKAMDTHKNVTISVNLKQFKNLNLFNNYNYYISLTIVLKYMY